MNNLPSELLIEIFSHASYWDLQYSIATTCKRFRALILNGDAPYSSLSENLFRDTTLTPTKNPPREYLLHPALSHIFIGPIVNVYTRPDMFFAYNSENPTIKMLKDTDIGGENAVSPAVQRVTLDLQYADGNNVRGEVTSNEDSRGVCVKELLDGFVKLAKERKEICLWSQEVGVEVDEDQGQVKVKVKVLTAMDYEDEGNEDDTGEESKYVCKLAKLLKGDILAQM